MKNLSFPRGYKVDEHGNVFSFKRKRLRLLKQQYDKDGYCKVELYHNGRKKKYSVHRLILSTYKGKCPEGMISRHLDGNPSNNSLDNLCWGTHKENEKDKIKHGTRLVGEQLHWTKLTKSDVLTIKNMINDGIVLKNIASEFGVSITLICDIKHGRSWRWLN